MGLKGKIFQIVYVRVKVCGLRKGEIVKKYGFVG